MICRLNDPTSPLRAQQDRRVTELVVWIRLQRSASNGVAEMCQRTLEVACPTRGHTPIEMVFPRGLLPEGPEQLHVIEPDIESRGGTESCRSISTRSASMSGLRCVPSESTTL